MSRRLVGARGAWTVVDIDAHRNQCAVRAKDGTFFVAIGTGERAIAAAAEYGVLHGSDPSWPTRAQAVAALALDFWHVDDAGDVDTRA